MGTGQHYTKELHDLFSIPNIGESKPRAQCEGHAAKIEETRMMYRILGQPLR
jgi:hypothetical protein